MTYKILYISAVIPDTTSGGRFAMYRHLIIKKDFEVAVASTNFVKLPIKQQLSIRRNRLIERLRRTRLCRLIYNLEYLLNWINIPGSLLKFADDFKPDVIVSVVDDWHLGLAFQLAHKLKVPLVVNFQDLFCLSQFVPLSARPYPLITSWLIQRYHQVNELANQVFYTSEGMKEWFGVDAQGDVLYPVGDFDVQVAIEQRANSQDKVKIIYAGNCYGAYGRMLLRLAESVQKHPHIHLQIFAAGNDWTPEKLQEMTEAGIYQGFKPFDELKDELKQADAFLTVMSFEKSEEIFMRTSFTTKWLDYVPYAKPVFVWTPEYSTACGFAKKYQSGISVIHDDPEVLLKVISETASNSMAWSSACEGSRRVAETVLNAEQIHHLFVERVTNVCQECNTINPRD
ncbi:MAG TPA: glycosyltransferase [Nodularia sp. (in: cyanobacteria)]|nr:glycosyltransferase [Nodularia sp. (in: cyanobacteria)]